MNTRMTQKQGFTLIELSIVLVIIGLIVGGVLVGQEMIKGAEVRAVIGQFEKYNAAINTFRNKYGGIPADLAAADTFFSYTTAGAVTRNGDGNGIIADSAGSGADPANFDALDNTAGIELAHFWPQLSAANLVDGTFVHTLQANILGTGNNFPVTKFNRGGIEAINIRGRNTFHVGLASVTAGAPDYTDTSSVSPNEAFQMDTKMDDGIPNSGVVRAVSGVTAAAIAAAPATGNTACLRTAATYNVLTSNAVQDSTICQLELMMM